MSLLTRDVPADPIVDRVQILRGKHKNSRAVSPTGKLIARSRTIQKCEFLFNYRKGTHIAYFGYTYSLTAFNITSSSAAQVLSISTAVKVGCTRNIRLVSPSSLATAKRVSGRHPVLSNAFSR